VSFNPDLQELTMNRKPRDICQLLTVAAALLVPAIGSANDGNTGRGRMHSEDRAHDDRYGGDNDEDKNVPFNKLSARWWQWMFSIPTADSPLLDQNGEKCMVGQRGPIWFLAGLAGPGMVSRSCQIPQGKTLFFPVANLVQVNTPGECGQTAPLSLADIRANLAQPIDSVSIRTVTLDGVVVGGVTRVRSVPFVVALPKDNLFVAPCANQRPAGQQAGIFPLAADDGYYVKIEGLEPGKHLLQFTAKNPDGTFNNNVAYELTVVPVSSR
jgi:hypothetical protein